MLGIPHAKAPGGGSTARPGTHPVGSEPAAKEHQLLIWAKAVVTMTARVRLPSITRKGYDAEDVGQGKEHGGGVLHRKNRRDIMMRVAAGFPALAGEAATEWTRNWRLWDAIMCGRHGRAVGHVVRNLRKEVLDAGAKGDTEAFRRLARRVAREVRKPEIVA